MSRVRRPAGGLVGDDPDPTPPEIRRDADLILDERDVGAELDLDVYDLEPYQPPALRERMGGWRKRYLPLPDEVVHEYLGEDEYVIHTDHPSFRAFLIKNGIQVLVLTVAGTIFVSFARGGFNWTTLVVFLIVDLVFAFLALKRLGDRYTSYVITNLRLIRCSGIIGRKLASIPWTRMTGIGYRQNALGRLLGYASIHLESANEESGLREFSDINDPATFHQHLLNMVAAKTGQSGDKSMPPPPTKGVRKSFMQRRRERRAALERAARLAIERERQHAREYAEGGTSRDIVDDTDTGETGNTGEDDTEPTIRPDTGGVYEALSTPDAPGRPVPPRRRPGPPAGRRRPPRRRPGPPGTGEQRRIGPQGGGPVRSSPPKRRRPPPKAKPSPQPPRYTEPDDVDDTHEMEPPRTGWKWPGSARAGGPAPSEPKAPRAPKVPKPPKAPKAPKPTSGSRRSLFARRPKPPKAAPTQRAEQADDEVQGGLSARDALGAVRRSSRLRPPAPKPRRPRRPSFGRKERPEAAPRRGEPPESRQLPAAPEDRDDRPEEPPEDEG